MKQKQLDQPLNLIKSSPIRAFLAGVLLLPAQQALQAQFTYTNIDGAITITGYTGRGGAVAIPSEINNLSVTSIGNNALQYIDTLTKVTIPNSVTSIGYFAFYGCDNLTNATIGDSVTNIGMAAFASCASLMEINVNAGNPAYASVDGALFDQTETTLIQYPIGQAAASYLIPVSVTTISTDAFEGSTNLTSITIPESVTNIGDGAFDNCHSLTNATIGDGVTSIGDEAFSVCTSLTSITIPDSVTTIGGEAFNACHSLTNATMGNSVTTIGGEAFENCLNLASITIPDSVTTIGGDAFAFCDLTNVTIPINVTNIGANAFYNCFSLMAINVNAGNPAYASVDGVLFNKTETTLVQCPIGLAAASYAIPNGVISIGPGAFWGCASLASVTIPTSVTSIGVIAFGECSDLASITIPDSVTNIGFGAFEHCENLTDATIGDGVTSIGGQAFWDCPILANATIGDGVTNIGASAFGACDSLATVLFQGNAPPASGVDPTAFDGGDLATIYYYQGATGWKSTFDGLPTVMLPPPPPPPPPFAAGGIQLSGSNVILTATNGLSGAACYVLMSTNLALPLSQWTPIATNVLDSSGTATITLTDAAAVGAMQSFYMLQQ